jgi:hypothetical protein
MYIYRCSVRVVKKKRSCEQGDKGALKGQQQEYHQQYTRERGRESGIRSYTNSDGFFLYTEKNPKDTRTRKEKNQKTTREI